MTESNEAMPASGWTLTGLAYAQVSMARDDLLGVARNLRVGSTEDAVEQLTVTIRLLEAARRHAS